MTLAIPTLAPDHSNLQFILDRLVQSGVDTGGRQIKLRFGSSSVTFTAADTSAQVTIPHGLGSAPVALFFSTKTPVAGRINIQESAAADATNFKVTGYQTGAVAISVTQNFYWMAVG